MTKTELLHAYALAHGMRFIVIDSVSEAASDRGAAPSLVMFDECKELDSNTIDMVQNRSGHFVPEIQQGFVPCKQHVWRRTKSRKLVCKNCGVDK